MPVRRTLSALAGVLIVSAGLLVGALPAAATTNCSTVIVGQTINDDVNVPSGAHCVIRTGSTVNGNITVQPGGSLFVFDSLVTGNIAGDRATIQVLKSTVRGNIVSLRPSGPPGTPGSFGVCGSSVGGSITVRNGVGTSLIAIGGPACAGPEAGGGNTIGGSVTDVNNQTVGAHQIGDNVIQGVLYCANNTPPPSGGNNTAAAKYGQCTTL